MGADLEGIMPQAVGLVTDLLAIEGRCSLWLKCLP
jgi:hypothetical protein